MNYFGMFICYFAPGLIVGYLLTVAFCLHSKNYSKKHCTKSRSNTANTVKKAEGGKLYVWNASDCKRPVQKKFSRAA